jgi:hypothetical protein
LGALAAQFLHARPDRSEIVGGPGPDALAAQFFHASPIIGKSSAARGRITFPPFIAWRTWAAGR